ncbi:hypothetical protein EJ02DRAFT_42051 [Clathrospora elynae]|uniref:Uncharacterized protein n=1 Tax=Clathrospora elynae TaxID=706981 RepID=A0A6A5SDJ0_9PLEO|nr:hypothetical protein EJ02DRAFT_42051 [Clathrospora elynae]
MAPQPQRQALDPRNSIFQSSDEKRGFIIVIILCVMATVGMLCLIIALVVLKNIHNRRKREAKMDAEQHLPPARSKQGKYQKLEDECYGEEGDVWNVEIDDRVQGRVGQGRGGHADLDGYAGKKMSSLHPSLDPAFIKDTYR